MHFLKKLNFIILKYMVFITFCNEKSEWFIFLYGMVIKNQIYSDYWSVLGLRKITVGIF